MQSETCNYRDIGSPTALWLVLNMADADRITRFELHEGLLSISNNK